MMFLVSRCSLPEVLCLIFNKFFNTVQTHLFTMAYSIPAWYPSDYPQLFYLIFKKIFRIYFNWRLITLQYCGGFCHTFTWISHGCTWVPHPEPLSHLPPHTIPQGHPSALALSTLPHALNLDWRSISHMLIYMFHCYSLNSSHPHLLPQSPKVCSLALCLFCCLKYRVIITIFLNSIYMH